MRHMLELVAAALVIAAVPASSLAEEKKDSGAFPLPLVDGKPIAVTGGQKHFRFPLGFDRISKFYREQLSNLDGVTLATRTDLSTGKRELIIRSRRLSDRWTKAVVREADAGTTIDLTPVVRAAEEQVVGQAQPLVQFVIGRSDEARKAVESIDHLER
jgi:hypothetical protein